MASYLSPYGRAVGASAAHHLAAAIGEHSFALGMSHAQDGSVGSRSAPADSAGLPWTSANPFLALAGPVETSPDGQTLFTTATVSEDGVQWRVVSVVVDAAHIIEECGLAALDSTYDVFLRDEYGHYLYGGGHPVSDDPVIQQVLVGGRVWELGGIPQGGWGTLSGSRFRLYQGATFSLFLLVTALVYRGSSRHRQLADLVADQGRELRLAREHDRLLLQDHPTALLVVDADNRILVANASAARLYQCQREELTGKSLDELHAYAKCIAEAACEDRGFGLRGEHWQRRLDGQSFLAELRAVPIEYDSHSCMLVSVDDITERQAADRALRSRDAILEAVGYASEQLLGPGSWEASVRDALAHLGQAAGVSRAYIFECYLEGNGKRRCSQRDEWAASGIAPQKDNTNLQSVAYDEVGFERWERLLSAGQIVHGHVHDLPCSEQALLAAQQILSLVVVPIFVSGALWGFVGFDECCELREWTTAEMDALRTAARVLGASLERRRVEDSLRASEARFRAVLDISNDAIYKFDIASSTYEYLSPSIVAVTGFRVEDVLRRGWLRYGERIHPEDRDAAFAYYHRMIAEAREGDRHWRVAYRWLHQDGTYRWFSENYSLVRDAGGSPVSVVGTLRDVTDEKASQEALRESEELFRGLVGTMDEGMGVEDSNGVIVYANNRLCEILGLPRMDLVGHPLGEVLDRIAPEIVHGTPSRGETGGSGPLEITWLQPNGRRVYTVVSQQALYDASGHYRGRCATVMDITERKHAEDLLVEHNRRLDLMARTATQLAELPLSEDPYLVIGERLCELCDAALVVVSRVDEETDSLVSMAAVSSAGSGMVPSPAPGFPLETCSPCLDGDLRQRLLGRRLQAISDRHLFGPNGAAQWPPALAGSLDLDELHMFGLARGDELIGSVCMAMRRGAPLPNAAMVEAFGYQATVFLLRQRAEAALRESEMRYRSLFENIGDAFFLLDDQLRITDYRDAQPAVFGLEREALAGRTLGEAMPDLMASQELKAALDEVLQTGSTRRGLEACVLGEGEAATLTLSLVAYAVQINSQLHVALLCQDVSAERQLEREARQADRLESLARMASGIAHDFGNLLAVIRGEGDLLLRKLPADSPWAEDAQRIVRASEAGASVTRELMAFSRGEQLVPEIVHLNKAVRDAAGLLDQVLGDNVAVNLDLLDQPIFFWGDLGQLDRVLLNLAVNARDAMPEGGTLSLRTRLVYQDGADAQSMGLQAGMYAVLSVADTGCGMDLELQPRIFEPFFTTRRLAHRTGLGLAVVYGIVQQHGGSIRVESQVGKGSAFHIYLPAVEAGWLNEKADLGDVSVRAE
ncbi:MAG: PAS domain S-box protein [Anaerolineae bacterium]